MGNLAKGATITLFSCSTGDGGQFALNMANFFASYAPEGTRVLAPMKDITNMEVTYKNDEPEISFRFLDIPIVIPK